ncbi:hemolysin family protein [Arsenicicoccus sp. oral taxon 190]|uniref:hemolysin family protein n=1 Tax=Arsenicicoccus sp. oral taxon 190 TaxID=1658671 RepID=UPI000679FFFE|nr:hemolysin family protein [Arsenicicoccus sp. oral taxon 190]AKT51421.1 membrane protein [Arsenicicoccus sp. oral taxon 190]
MSTSVALWISVFLLFGNAFFVGASFAVMAARRSQLEPLAEQGSGAARRCLEALEQVAAMLVCAQLGITVCSLGLGALAEVALHHVFEGWLHALHLSPSLAAPLALALALLLVVYLHVVVGEMIPKNLAIAGPERAALLLVPALLAVTTVLRPFIWVMERLAKAIIRAFGVEPKDELASTFTAQEVGEIVAESHREGLLEEDQHGLVRGALEFSDRVAGEVAVPLADVVSLAEGATPEDLERLVAKHGYSRYPVTDGDGDIVGYVHLKDILYAREEDFDEPIPAKRIRRLATVRAGDEVEDVLATMQRTGRHLAQVLDEADERRVTGIVFLEDVLEELVGEVSDQSQRTVERVARVREAAARIAADPS